jgi:hypothetical protein
LKGQVPGPDGKPVAGAKVALATSKFQRKGGLNAPRHDRMT